MSEDRAALIASDVYLQVTAKRAGVIKGEATTAGHENQIVVLGWKWGMSTEAAGSRSGTQAAGRRTLKSLTVTKTLDCASTGLSAALDSNDELKEVVLSMRKAGGIDSDYYRITLKQGRLTSLEHEAASTGIVTETLTFSYNSIELSYRKQLATGQLGAGFTFSTDV